MASSSLAKLHHPPLWLATLLILLLSLSPSSSLAAELGRFSKFYRTNSDPSTTKDTTSQDPMADLDPSKEKTLAEVEADGADPQPENTIPKTREEQFRLWNEYQNAKLAAKEAKQTHSKTSLDSEEWNQNYQKQKKQFLSDKGEHYKQPNEFSPNQLKYGPREGRENGYGLQRNSYEAYSNEDFDLENTNLDDTSFPRFQPTKLGSQKRNENLYQPNNEEGENGYRQQSNSYETKKDDFDLDNTQLYDTSFSRFQPTNLRSQEQNENLYQPNNEKSEEWLDRGSSRTATGGYRFGSRQPEEQEREGMSDTRFYKNGKFYYDTLTKKFSLNHPYNQINHPSESVGSVRNEYPQKDQPESDLWEDDELEP